MPFSTLSNRSTQSDPRQFLHPHLSSRSYRRKSQNSRRENAQNVNPRRKNFGLSTHVLSPSSPSTFIGTCPRGIQTQERGCKPGLTSWMLCASISHFHTSVLTPSRLQQRVEDFFSKDNITHFITNLPIPQDDTVASNNKENVLVSISRAPNALKSPIRLKSRYVCFTRVALL